MKTNIIEMVSGDDDGIPSVCLNPVNDQPIDISSFPEIIFTVRDKKKKVLIQKKLSLNTIIYVTDGTDGQLTILITKQDTHNLKGVFKYDLQFSDTGGVDTTPVRAFIKIKEDETE